MRIILAVGLLILTLVGAGVANGQPVALYVATNGNDANPGTEARPFASLERARDEARKIKGEGVTVWVRGGTYVLEKTFELAKEDSGTEKAPVVYRAVQNAEVRLAGGREIAASAFKPVTDPEVLGRMDGAGRGKVLQADLTEVTQLRASKKSFENGLAFAGRWRAARLPKVNVVKTFPLDKCFLEDRMTMGLEEKECFCGGSVCERTGRRTTTGRWSRVCARRGVRARSWSRIWGN
jgi:hypothetical protein